MPIKITPNSKWERKETASYYYAKYGDKYKKGEVITVSHLEYDVHYDFNRSLGRDEFLHTFKPFKPTLSLKEIYNENW